MHLMRQFASIVYLEVIQVIVQFISLVYYVLRITYYCALYKWQTRMAAMECGMVK